MTTQLFGLLGWPVGHSASPAMMNAAFRTRGLDAVYVAFAVQPERLEEAVRGLSALGARGVNVTIPHKRDVLPLCAQVTDAARLAGAVNTLRFDEAGLISGHNTDVSGWWQGIADELPDGPLQVAVLGAGGAVRAVAAALTLYAADRTELVIIARSEEKGRGIAQDFRDHLSVRTVPWARRHDAIAAANVVVQCTPIGMWPEVDSSPVDDAGCFWQGQLVQDIVYRPLETRFLRQARDRGARVADGLRMLVQQGAMAYEYWLGEPAPIAEMDAAARRFLAENRS